MAATLIAIGWTGAELRRNDLDNMRQELNAYRAEMASEHRIIFDSLGTLSQRTRAQTYRVCRFERQMRLEMSQLCVEAFGKSVQGFDR